MATADELLGNASVQPNPEGHIVVGGDRFITVPSNLKRLGVQYDHNMETVVFDCPRYWDDRDMSQMAVYINYALSDGYMDRYPADNVKADGDIMHFEWTISRNVTQVAGQVSFLVCVMKTDSEGNEERHWNSELCQACYISPGMETEESPVDMYPDIITQLLLRMSTVEQINVQADEMNQIMNATENAADRAEAARDVAVDSENHIRDSYANAIKQNASGEIIRVDDVSPIEHTVKCRVHGKNLANLNNIVRSLSVDLSYVEPELHIIKTNTTEKWSNIYVGIGVYKDFVGKTLTASLDNESNYVWSVLLVGTNGKGELIREIGGESATNGHTTFTVTIPEMQDAELLAIRMVSGDNKITTGEEYILKNIQVEEGTVATAYEPYIDPSTVTVTGCGKNLFQYPYDGSTYGNGITFTDKGDGTIVVNGTNNGESNSVYYLAKDAYVTLPAGTYSCSPNVAGIGIMGVEQGGGYFTFCSVNKTSFTLAQPTTFRSIYIQILKGATNTYNSLTIKPMLECGANQSSFEPYSGKIVAPDSSGLCIVTSESPTMTIFTDTPGMTIEAEYNVDTKKFLEANLTDEKVQAAVNKYLTDNPVSAGNLVDTVTGKTYTLNVVNGKLTLIELEV